MMRRLFTGRLFFFIYVPSSNTELAYWKRFFVFFSCLRSPIWLLYAILLRVFLFFSLSLSLPAFLVVLVWFLPLRMWF